MKRGKGYKKRGKPAQSMRANESKKKHTPQMQASLQKERKNHNKNTQHDFEFFFYQGASISQTFVCAPNTTNQALKPV